VRHVVDRKLAEALALGNALGEQTGSRTMRRREPVADKQDDVLRLARPGIVDRPPDGAAARAIADFHCDVARPGQGDAAKRQRRLILAVFALHERSGLAEGSGMVLAVYGHFQFSGIDAIRKLNFEVEARAGENRRAVDRVDGLGSGLASRQQDKEGRGSEGFDHEVCTRSGSEQDEPRRQPPAPGKAPTLYPSAPE
jgi:hypothetical protein